MKEYNSFLGAFLSGNKGQGGYNAAYGKSALAKLYSSQDPAEQQAAAEGLARVDPESARKWQQEQAAIRQEGLKRKATMIASAPPEHRGQLYSAVLPDIRKDWAEAPEQYTPELDQMVQAWAQSVGGSPQNTGVQSTFISGGNLNYLTRDGRTVNTGKSVDDSYQAIIDPVTGQVSGYARRGNQLLPAGAGARPQPQANQSPQEQSDPMQPHLDRIASVQKEMTAAGVPVEQINAWAEKAFSDAQNKVASNGATFTEQAPSPAAGQAPVGGQAKVSVKEDKLTLYQQEQIRLQQQAAARAEQAAKDAAAAKAKASEAADRDRQGRVAAAKQTTDNLLTNIRVLKNHPGFPQLGTVGGNAADKVLPEFMPTEYRGAKGRLETIKGQIALQAMASLKALSSSGATGFGALAVPELILLQNSIQTLTTSQNNSDILASINQIETLLTKAGQAGQAAPSASGKQVGRFVIEEN